MWVWFRSLKPNLKSWHLTFERKGMGMFLGAYKVYGVALSFNLISYNIYSTPVLKIPVGTAP